MSFHEDLVFTLYIRINPTEKQRSVHTILVSYGVDILYVSECIINLE